MEMNLTRAIRSIRGALWSDSNYTRLVLAKQVPLEVLCGRLLRPAAGPHAVRRVPGRAGDVLRKVGAARPFVVIRLFFVGYLALLLALAMSADRVHNSYGLSEAMQAAIRAGSSR